MSKFPQLKTTFNIDGSDVEVGVGHPTSIQSAGCAAWCTGNFLLLNVRIAGAIICVLGRACSAST